MFCSGYTQEKINCFMFVENHKTWLIKGEWSGFSSTDDCFLVYGWFIFFCKKKNRSAGIMIHVRIRLVNSCVYFEVEIWNCISIDIICYWWLFCIFNLHLYCTCNLRNTCNLKCLRNTQEDMTYILWRCIL